MQAFDMRSFDFLRPGFASVSPGRRVKSLGCLSDQKRTNLQDGPVACRYDFHGSADPLRQLVSRTFPIKAASHDTAR